MTSVRITDFIKSFVRVFQGTQGLSMYDILFAKFKISSFLNDKC